MTSLLNKATPTRKNNLSDETDFTITSITEENDNRTYLSTALLC